MADAAVVITGTPSSRAGKGLSAQALATLAALHSAGHTRLAVLDGGNGLREDHLLHGRQRVRFERYGATLDKPFWQSHAFARLERGVREGRDSNLGLRRFMDADAVVDVSPELGLTDTGNRRDFRNYSAPLLLAIRQNKPLFLCPRRIGPFRDAANGETARVILRHARMVWARDAGSFDRMKALLGADFDPTRHLLGVDPAFALWSAPIRLAPERLPWFLGRADRDRPPVVGVEVCGFLAHGRASERRRGVRTRYLETLAEIIDALLLQTSANVLLIPAPNTGPLAAQGCEALLERCRPQEEIRRRTRIAMLREDLNPLEQRWLRGRLDWFCGTHAEGLTSAISAGTPTAGLVADCSARSVLQNCGTPEGLFDLRALGSDALRSEVLAHFADRRAHRAGLAVAVTALRRQVRQQQESLAQAISAVVGAPLRQQTFALPSRTADWLGTPVTHVGPRLAAAPRSALDG